MKFIKTVLPDLREPKTPTTLEASNYSYTSVHHEEYLFISFFTILK